MLSILILLGGGLLVLCVLVLTAILVRRNDNSIRKIPTAHNSSPLPSPFTPSVPFDEQELLSLLRNGQKIQAIKRYREMTGVGLKEAKDAVESLEIPRRFDSAVSNSDDSEYRRLLEQGQKIQAIKLYRERTGLGLKDAKDAIDALENRL